jgi:hypothetical protein
MTADMNQASALCDRIEIGITKAVSDAQRAIREAQAVLRQMIEECNQRSGGRGHD